MSVDDQIAILGNGNQGGLILIPLVVKVLRIVTFLPSSPNPAPSRHTVMVPLAGGQRDGRLAGARRRVAAWYRRESEYASVWARQRQGWDLAERRRQGRPGERGGGEQLL